MKKRYLILPLIGLMLISFGCRREGRSLRSFKDKMSEKVEEGTSENRAPVMTEIESTEEVEAQDIEDFTGNENYRKLMSIAAKCDDPDFTLENLSQSDYAFMISFCNMMMDTAEEADMAGKSDEYLQEFENFQELLQGFAMLLGAAYNEDMLDTANTHDFELMMRRAQYVAQ